MTFNEINTIMFLPAIPTGIRYEDGEDPMQVTYQAAHHILVASAQAVKLGHSIDPEFKIGMMMIYPTFYGETCNPEDQLESMRRSDQNYYFSDVQVRGAYSSKAKKFLERHHVSLAVQPEDEKCLKEGVVDYIGFSYYNSNVASASQGKELTGGNMMNSVKNLIWKSVIGVGRWILLGCASR
jgi:6-phospho-beta-glucosidase